MCVWVFVQLNTNDQHNHTTSFTPFLFFYMNKNVSAVFNRNLKLKSYFTKEKTKLGNHRLADVQVFIFILI